VKRFLLGARALRDCAPSAPWGASMRPLNFPVRRHAFRLRPCYPRGIVRLPRTGTLTEVGRELPG
jgi:hypothetical protein